MEIKTRVKRTYLEYAKKNFKNASAKIFGKKTRILLFSAFILGFFLIGSFAGLIFSGYFGTFDNPSPKAAQVLASLEIPGIKKLKAITEGAIKENFKVIPNFILGKMSSPEEISLDVKFKDWKKIEYKRNQALERGILISSSEDYVPATISTEDTKVDSKIRLKGDLRDHYEGDKWSLRVNVKGGDTLFGMDRFSIQAPQTRNYLNEYVYKKALEREGILSPKYGFIKVKINGENKGIYAIEEHFEKQLIERNQRREGVIIKFNEDFMWEQRLEAKENMEKWEYEKYVRDNFEDYWFYSSKIEAFDEEDIVGGQELKILNEAKSLLESFRQGELKTSQVFDTELLAKYFAINTVIKASHASAWSNIRFYYNPINSKLEPIGYDATSDVDSVNDILDRYLINCLARDNCVNSNEFYKLIFDDIEFYEKYIKELEKVSKKEYLDSFFDEIGEDLKDKKRIIHKENPFYHFSERQFYDNQKIISLRLNSPQDIIANFDNLEDGRVKISVGNLGTIPIKIDSLIYEDSSYFPLGKNIVSENIPTSPVKYQNFEFILPESIASKINVSRELKIKYSLIGLEDFRHQGVDYFVKSNDGLREVENNDSKNILKFDDYKKEIFIEKGRWVIDNDLVIPEGYTLKIAPGNTLDLIDDSMILSYSPVFIEGAEGEEIRIISSDGTGRGLTVIEADGKSSLKNFVIKDNSNPVKGAWELFGSINFYKSDVSLKKSIINNSKSEDSLNIINSIFEIEDVVFDSCNSDCFDSDFSSGEVMNSEFVLCGNDCLDFSGSEIKVDGVSLRGFGDKGISIGEKSNITISNTDISSPIGKQGRIGIAIKDNSFLIISNSTINNSDYGFAMYQKKSEYGPASMIATNVTIHESVDEDYIIEKDSSALIDGKIFLSSLKNVFEKIY